MDASSQTQPPRLPEPIPPLGDPPPREISAPSSRSHLALPGTVREALGSPQGDDLAPPLGDTHQPRDRSYGARRIPWRLLSIEDLFQIETHEFLVDGVIPGGGVTFLYGQSGLGKSFVALDLAFTVASGSKTWLNRKVSRSGPVLYVVGEGLADLPARAGVWLDSRDAPNELLDELRFTDLPPNLTDERQVDALIGQAQRLRVALIVIDTLTACAPGADQNNTSEMGLAVHHLQRLASTTDAPVLVVHHPGKDDSRGMRGSNSIHAGVDCVIKLAKRRGKLTLVSEKQRAAANFADIEIALVSQGYSLIVNVGPSGETNGRQTGSKLSSEHQLPPTEQPSQSSSPARRESGAVASVISTIPWSGAGAGYASPSQIRTTTGMADSTVRWALRRLCEDGRICRSGRGVYGRIAD